MPLISRGSVAALGVGMPLRMSAAGRVAVCGDRDGLRVCPLSVAPGATAKLVNIGGAMVLAAVGETPRELRAAVMAVGQIPRGLRVVVGETPCGLRAVVVGATGGAAVVGVAAGLSVAISSARIAACGTTSRRSKRKFAAVTFSWMNKRKWSFTRSGFLTG